MTIHTTTSTLRTQLTASIRLERLMEELAGLDAELTAERNRMFDRLADVDDLDDAGRAINNARSDLEIARRSLKRVWAMKGENA
jgi:hypothetical protein